MANFCIEFFGGLSGLCLAVMRAIVLIICVLSLISGAVELIFIHTNFTGVISTLFGIIINSFGAVGAYKKNYRFLLLFGLVSVVFATVVLIFHDSEKSRTNWIDGEKKKMLDYARDYDFNLAPNSTGGIANSQWDKWQSGGCCGNDGPSDWVNWGRPGPPRACCANEQDVSPDNVCKRPYKAGCMERYLIAPKVVAASEIYVFIFTLINGIMALLMALNYYIQESQNEADAGGQSTINRPSSKIDANRDTAQATSGQVQAKGQGQGQGQVHGSGHAHGQGHTKPVAHEQAQQQSGQAPQSTHGQVQVLGPTARMPQPTQVQQPPPAPAPEQQQQQQQQSILSTNRPLSKIEFQTKRSSKIVP